MALPLAAVGAKVSALIFNALNGAVTNKQSYVRAAVQPIPTATSTVILFDTPLIAGTGWTYAAGTGIFTCVTPGVYEVTARTEFAANATGVREQFITKNAATLSHVYTPSVTASNYSLSDFGASTFIAGDTISVSGRQTSGGSLNITTATVFIEFVTN